MRFVDPKNDFAFKKIFGDENKTSVLISLLNSVLDFNGDEKIKSLTIVNPCQVPKIEDLKETVLDIKAVNMRDEHFIVEMQKKDHHDFAKRSLYYTSKAYVSQLKPGKDQKYSSLQKVYFIGLLDFNMLEGDNYVSRHLILNKETLNQDIADFEFAFIELKKFNKELNQLETVLDKWIYFINNVQNLDMIPQEFETIEEFKLAFETASQCGWDIEELDIYEYIALREHEDQVRMERGLAKAKSDGWKEGLEKGIEKGIAQGAEQAIINSIETMYKNGLAVKDIAIFLSISEEKVSKIILKT